MKATLESTDRVIEVNGVPARVWQGVTAAGVPFVALITRVAVHRDADHGEFAAELQEEHAPPEEAAIRAFPARMVL